MSMTLAQARKLLPPFARGLGMFAKTLDELRESVKLEIRWNEAGVNPLTTAQAKQLKSFLNKTEVPR